MLLCCRRSLRVAAFTGRVPRQRDDAGGPRPWHDVPGESRRQERTRLRGGRVVAHVPHAWRRSVTQLHITRYFHETYKQYYYSKTITSPHTTPTFLP